MMNPKSFVVLAGVTAVVCAGAVASSLSWSSGSAVSKRGETFLPSLAKSAGEIGSIVIETPDETVTLMREGDRFVDSSGYPIKPQAARNLLASVSVLKIEEKKTADVGRHEDLELAPPDAKTGGGKQISFLGKDGKALTGLVAGERDSSVGGVSGGQYVRALGNDQTYLVRGSVKLPYSRAGWFNNKLLEIDVKTVTGFSVNSGEGARVGLTKVADKLKLVDLPAGKVEDEDKIRRLSRLFGGLTFADVRKAEGDAPAEAPVLTVGTADGLSVTLTNSAMDKEDVRWIRIAAESTKDSGKEQAAALAAKFGGFEFKITSYDGEPFGWKIDDLTKAPGS